MTALPQSGDEEEFGRKLNSELREAKLFCGRDALDQQMCPDWILLGYLRDLKFRRSSGFLVLQTAVGIECGFDQSAYIYSWSEEGWRRVWQTEQNVYTQKAYRPQTIHAVLISPYNKANDYVVLTLGSQSWCMSNLRDVYYRAFRLGPDLEAPPLVEGAERAYVANDPPIQGSVTVNDVLVEFAGAEGVELGHHSVRRYRLDQDGAKRIDPLALGLVISWMNGLSTIGTRLSLGRNRPVVVRRETGTRNYIRTSFSVSSFIRRCTAQGRLISGKLASI